jgi:hypothetical protein
MMVIGRNTIRSASMAVLIGTTVLMPATGVASVLTGGDPLRIAEVTQGVWILKVSLLATMGWMALIWVFLTNTVRRIPMLQEGTGTASERLPLETPVLLALLGLALVLRIVALGDGLWFDEIQTLVDYARLPAGQVVTTFDSQNNHLLYSLFASVTLSLFGESAATLRLPAVFFGVASLWALHRFGSAVTSRRETLFAVTLMAVSYHHVWFSQNARGYTALLFFTLLGTWAFLLLLSRTPSWGLIAGYGLAMGLATYTHVTAALTVVAHGGIWSWLAWRHRPTEWRAPLLALVLSGLVATTLYALVLPQLFDTLLPSTHSAQTTEWQSPLWLVVETIRGLARGLPGGWLAVLIGLALAASGMWSYWRRSPIVLMIMVLPPVLTAGMALALSHNLWPRFFFFAAGFALLILVRGIYTVSLLAGRRAGPVAAVATLVVAVGSALTVPRAWQPKQDYKGATTFVEETRASGDAMVTVDLTIFPVTEYLARPWQTATDGSSLEAIEENHSRTWVMYTFPVRLETAFPEIYKRMTSNYDTAAVFPGTIGGGTILVMVTP